MEKKNLDWANLGFGYMTTDYRYVANYKNGAWDKGGLTDDPTVTLNECAGIFHYCQEIFEGLKALYNRGWTYRNVPPGLKCSPYDGQRKASGDASVPGRAFPGSSRRSG